MCFDCSSILSICCYYCVAVFDTIIFFGCVLSFCFVAHVHQELLAVGLVCHLPRTSELNLDMSCVLEKSPF